MRVAGLDLGSNTFILTICDVTAEGLINRLIVDEVRYVRLGQGVDKTKQFHPEALLRARAALDEFTQLIASNAVDKVLATATSAARDVSNGQELLKMCQEHSIPVEIISGDREAELTYLGARTFQKAQKAWVIDIGGGSTEIIYGEGEKILWRHSFDLGCVRLAERWSLVPPADDQVIAEALFKLQAQFKDKLPKEYFAQGDIIAVAGTPVEVARLHLGSAFNMESIEGLRLSSENMQKLIKIVCSGGPEELVAKFNTPKGRADVLLPGLLLLQAFMSVVGIESMKVSKAGIRFGVVQMLAKGELCKP